MDGKAEGRWLGTSPCDNERTIALRTNADRSYEGKSSELIPPGPRPRVGTYVQYFLLVYMAENPYINQGQIMADKYSVT